MQYNVDSVEWIEPDKEGVGGKERVLLPEDVVKALSVPGTVFLLTFDSAKEYRSITVKMRQTAKIFGNGFNQNVLTKPFTQKTLAKSGPHGDVSDEYIEVMYKVEILRERI